MPTVPSPRAPTLPAPLPPAALVAGFVVVAALCASAAPLLVYSTTLATLGAVHVGTELRYVDERFGRRPRPALRAILGVLLAGIVGLRTLAVAKLIGPSLEIQLELLLVAALAVAVVPAVSRKGGARGAVAAAVAVVVGAGALLAPIDALIVLAVLHNATPVGFLAERLEGGRRTRALLACVVVFLLVPAALVAGAADPLLAPFGGARLDAALLRTGPLNAHLGVFVPRSLFGWSRAEHLFAAATYLQCCHYAVVIGVLPRLSRAGAPDAPAPLRPLVRWPSRRAFLALLVAAAGLSLWGFATEFGDARAVYGIAAALHAWVEVPVLLLALCGSERAGGDLPAGVAA